jgi:hypothetical protein
MRNSNLYAPQPLGCEVKKHTLHSGQGPEEHLKLFEVKIISKFS